jgi:hypothetical protein
MTSSRPGRSSAVSAPADAKGITAIVATDASTRGRERMAHTPATATTTSAAAAAAIRTPLPRFAARGMSAGCEVGEGEGWVKSDKLFVDECWDGPFDLGPDFFAANSFERGDQLMIRVQRGDAHEEMSDGLIVNIDRLPEQRARIALEATQLVRQPQRQFQVAVVDGSKLAAERPPRALTLASCEAGHAADHWSWSVAETR